MFLEKELIEIIKIPSVSGNMKEINNCLNYCINFVLESIDKNKIFINRKEFNGVPSVLISNTETMDFDVLSVGHIDAVPAKEDLFIPKVLNNRIYGRGSADMKSGVLLSLDILKDIIKLNKNIKYGVLIVSDEEIGGQNGSKKWAEIGLNSKILLDYDSGDGFDYIAQKIKGFAMVEIKTKGIEAHGSMPWEGLDANNSMFILIQELQKIFKNYSIYNKPKNAWTSTMHIAKIKGGDAINKISSQCEAIIDFRLTEKYGVNEITNILNKIIEKKSLKNVEYNIIFSGKTICNNLNNVYFKKYLELYEKEVDKKLKIGVFNGTTDIRYFANENNVVIHHNPDIGPIHSDTEFVDLITLKKLKDLGLKFLMEI